MKDTKKGWERFLEEARGYHKTVRGSVKRPEVFTPEIIQNIAAMGIEKYFMAVFTRRGHLPQNHTMRDFVEEIKPFSRLPESLEKDLLYFDSLQSICSIDDYSIVKPKGEDVERFIRSIDQVAAMAERETGNAPPADS